MAVRDDREDFDFEVTDLARGQTLGSEKREAPNASEAAGHAAGPKPPREHDQARADGRSIGTWTAGQVPRRPRRTRLLGIATAIVAVAIALALILASLPNPRLTLATWLHLITPTPTALPPPGPGTLALEHWVPWGTLQVDGKTADAESLEVHSIFYDGRVLPRLDLPPGRHTISFRAAPFPSLRCALSVPAALDDSCPLAPRGVAQPTDGGVRPLDLGASLDQLSAESRAALLTLVPQALGSMFGAQPAVVAPGEWYRAADGSVARAKTPLLATFLYVLNQDATRSLPDYGRACVSLCETTFRPDLDFRAWHLTAHALPRWTYRDAASGSVLIAQAPAASRDADASLDVVVPLHVVWSGGWHVTPAAASDTNPTCAVMVPELDVVFDLPIGAPMASYGAPTAAQGCANNTARNFPGPPAYFLYQFGVVVAANPAAHQMRPGVPLGDAQQQALAARLAGG